MAWLGLSRQKGLFVLEHIENIARAPLATGCRPRAVHVIHPGRRQQSASQRKSPGKLRSRQGLAHRGGSRDRRFGQKGKVAGASHAETSTALAPRA